MWRNSFVMIGPHVRDNSSETWYLSIAGWQEQQDSSDVSDWHYGPRSH